MTDVFAPAPLGPVELRNRIVKAATFEGMSPHGVVSEQLIEFHRRMAAGGVGMTTVSYLAVSENGRGAPNEIYIHDGAREGLEKIAGVVHAEGARISAQLGHAGAVGVLPGKKVLGPSKAITLMGSKVSEISRAEIDEVVAQFAAGGAMLADAGFDCVELHLGHHYLPSSFLSPKWNRRTDDYGGSIENRARFPLAIIRAVHEAVGGRMAITAKMNMDDGIKKGLHPEESIRFAKLFEAEGKLDALELSGGGSQVNQMYMFRGEAPRKEFAEVLPGKLKYGFKLVGPLVFRNYPFEEAYFLPMARRFRKELSMPLILLGGINRLDTIQSALDEGFEFVAIGRALLREPDLPNRWREGTAQESRCIHCNKCMVSIYSGTRCVIDHPEPLKLV